MEISISLDVLFEALMILGHGRVWMHETEFEHYLDTAATANYAPGIIVLSPGGMMLMTHGIYA